MILDKLYKLTPAQCPACKREVARATGLVRDATSPTGFVQFLEEVPQVFRSLSPTPCRQFSLVLL